MKKTFFAVLAIAFVLIIVGFAFSGEQIVKETNTDTPLSQWKTYTSDILGFTFTYPNTYFLETRELGDGHRGHFSTILTEDTEENRLVREGKSPGREGPVSISFEAYQSPDEPTPLDWVKKNPASNFHLSDGTYTEVGVAEKSAIAYHWSGLYEADNLVLAHQDYIFSATVTYITPQDHIRSDFSQIIETLKFR